MFEELFFAGNPTSIPLSLYLKIEGSWSCPSILIVITLFRF
jgi:hypothetical protein